MNYGNYSGVFCKHSGGSIILSEVIYICNIAQSGMLPYPHNYTLDFWLLFLAKCACTSKTISP